MSQSLTLTECEIYLKFVSSNSMNVSIIITNIKERVCPLCVFAYSIKGLWNSVAMNNEFWTNTNTE